MLPREFCILNPLRGSIFGQYQQHLPSVVVMYVCMQYPSTKDSKLGTQTATLSVRCGHALWSEAVMLDFYFQTFALSYWGTCMLFTSLNLLRWVEMGSKRIIRDMEVIQRNYHHFRKWYSVYGDQMAAMCKLLSFASIILAIFTVLCCTDSWEIYMSDSQKSETWDQRLRASVNGRQEKCSN